MIFLRRNNNDCDLWLILLVGRNIQKMLCEPQDEKNRIEY